MWTAAEVEHRLQHLLRLDAAMNGMVGTHKILKNLNTDADDVGRLRILL